MTRSENKPSIAAVKDLMGANHDGLREIVQDLLQEMLEGKMTEALGASKSERSDGRVGYRSGHYNRTLITRVGNLELRVPQDRDGRFSTELFERYQRSEQSLVATLAEMYVQGVSTRNVKAITEELCGPSFSASTISAINKRLDEPFAYLIIDAKHEKVRQAGVVRSCAVLVASASTGKAGGRFSRSSSPTARAAHRGRTSSSASGTVVCTASNMSSPMIMRACVQRFVKCCPMRGSSAVTLHFLRNALDHLPRKADDDCLQELRWIYDRRELSEAKSDLAAWLRKWSPRYPKLTGWAEENIEETFTLLQAAAAASQTHEEHG
jgi:transposase-like protein